MSTSPQALMLKRDGCVFCQIPSDPEQRRRRISSCIAAEHNFVVLNLYPYISGHLLIVPYLHIGDLDSTAKEITDEMMDLTKRSQTALARGLQPAGFNIGMNLGAAAGAGIADHIHIHILPRWTGDTNFMTTVAETRVLPEDLATTYHKLRDQSFSHQMTRALIDLVSG